MRMLCLMFAAFASIVALADMMYWQSSVTNTAKAHYAVIGCSPSGEYLSLSSPSGMVRICTFTTNSTSSVSTNTRKE